MKSNYHLAVLVEAEDLKVNQLIKVFTNKGFEAKTLKQDK